MESVPSPTPTPTPRPSPTPSLQNVNVGLLNSRAVSLPKPAYPPMARQMNASGKVTVQVMIDEEGNVLSAKATNGHALLRSPAEAAARQSRFNPVRVAGQPVRATGVILYNFINQ
ncbi:MAG: energy transducer TonB [Acidobacteriota bacterium]|nr:energy transducer TonB [Acidobacteriota bacterium]